MNKEIIQFEERHTKKFEEIMDLAQALQDAVMELGFIMNEQKNQEQKNPQILRDEEGSL